MSHSSSSHSQGFKGRLIALTVVIVIVAGVVYTSWARETSDTAKIAKLGTVSKEVQLVPHRAFYKIEMTSAKPMSDINNVSGEMAFVWNRNCEGWLADHRFNLLYEYAENPGVRMTSDFSTFEAEDGSRFEFVSTKRRDGEIIDHYRGSASLKDGNGEAAYRDGNIVTKMPLKGATFPMEHSKAIIEAARAGKKFFTATVFDGSERDGPIVINGIILDPKTAASLTRVSTKDMDHDAIWQEDEVFEDNKLLDVPSYLVRLAFFNMAQESAEPDYEMTVRLYENGIITHMDIDYDTFSVSQSLMALESVETPSCPKTLSE